VNPFPALPGMPSFPPLDEEPEFAPIPKVGQIVVVTDGEEDEGELTVVQNLAKRIKEHRKLRVRELDFEEAQKTYPVEEDELPLVLVTSDGRIEAKILGRLLDAIEPPVPTPATKIVDRIVEKPVERIVNRVVNVETPAEVESVADVPWAIILQILTGGFTPAAGIALAIWGFRAFRSYRKAKGQKLLINDDAMVNVVLERAAPVVEKLVAEVLARLKPVPPAAADQANPELKR
jgi:hypothetical protein